ncbi:MAG: arsenate reductase ArsC [Sumerlaeia bacterium]
MSERNILVLCTGNSCRSQMAEAFIRRLAGERFEVFSAGLEPAPEIHPLALRVMDEIGEIMEGQHPKSVKTYLGRMGFRYVVFVCADAENSCPRIFPGVLNFVNLTVDDPAKAEGTQEERLEVFRRVRDELHDKIERWVGTLDA